MALDWPLWRTWFPVGAVVAVLLAKGGVALGEIAFHFANRRGTYGSALGSQLTPQLWHLATSPFTLRGRRGTWRHGPSLCVAGVALGDIDLHFAWQAWHLWHWTGFGGALGSQLTPLSPRLLEWQAWHLATSTSTLRGRRGTW